MHKGKYHSTAMRVRQSTIVAAELSLTAAILVPKATS
jgi:hypothetical protein